MSASVEEIFSTEAGSGPLVVLLHGQPGTHEDLGALADRLSSCSTVVSIDRPGYGGSGSSPCSIAHQVEVLAGLLQARREGPALVVGHSFGGAVALVLAADRPDLVSGVVLLGSVGGAGSIVASDQLLALPLLGEVVSWSVLTAYGVIAPALARIGSRRALEANVPIAPTRSTTRHLATFVSEQRSLLAERKAIESAIAKVRCRALVIHGALDAIVPLSAGIDLAARIPGSRLVVLDHAGHLLPRDEPDRVAQEVRALLG